MSAAKKHVIKSKLAQSAYDFHPTLVPDLGAVIAMVVLGILVLVPWLMFRRWFKGWRSRRSGRGSAGVFRKMRPLWKILNEDGYVLTESGQLEHRVIAEKVLGRRLESSEDVHHMNGVRHDNRPENLCVMDHRDHVRYHRWYDWVRGKGTFPRRETQLRKLRGTFRGVVLGDVLGKKIG